MHELSLMTNIISTADKMLAEYCVRHVSLIDVRVGILANVLPDAISFAFESLSQDTVYQGAELRLEKSPLQAVCKACGQTYDSMSVPPICPGCGSHDAKVIGGTEVLLTAIDFEEEGQ